MTFLRTSPLAGGQKRERVLAVDTPGGAILLSVSGLDTDQYTAMLPGYLLAKRSLTLSR